MIRVVSAIKLWIETIIVSVIALKVSFKILIQSLQVTGKVKVKQKIIICQKL